MNGPPQYRKTGPTPPSLTDRLTSCQTVLGPERECELGMQLVPLYSAAADIMYPVLYFNKIAKFLTSRKWILSNFHIKQFFVKLFPSLPRFSTIFSEFLDPCYGVMLDSTFLEMRHIWQTCFPRVNVTQMPPLSFVYFLLSFTNILFSAFLAGQAVDDIACFTRYWVADYECFVSGGYLYCVAKCTKFAGVASFVFALWQDSCGTGIILECFSLWWFIFLYRS